jgi:hypothetical protein
VHRAKPTDDTIRALDVSNGSLLGIALATHVVSLEPTNSSASTTRDEVNSNVEVVSIEADLQAKRMFELLWNQFNNNNNNNNNNALPESDGEQSATQRRSVTFSVMESAQVAHASGSAPPFNMLISELHYTSLCARPLLGALNFWHQARALRASGVVAADAVCVPSRVQVFACLVSAPGLVKAHGPLGAVCGFDHSTTFDNAWADWDAALYHYPLWQYSTTTRSAATSVLSLDMEHSNAPPNQTYELMTRVDTETDSDGFYVHAVVLWTAASGKSGGGEGNVEESVEIWDEKGPGKEPSAWPERAVKFLKEPLFVPSGAKATVDVKVALVNSANEASPGGGGVLRVETSKGRVCTSECTTK